MDTLATEGILYRDRDVRLSAIDNSSRSVRVVASTSVLDSHSTILDQDWRLDRYLKNPIVLWNHNNFAPGPISLGGAVQPEHLLPIGRAEDVRVTGSGLEATLVLASADLNPLAERILRMIREGLLRSVSVGFRPGKVAEEKLDGREIYRLSQNELYEISFVPIGSNPDAVARSIATERACLAQLARGHRPPRSSEPDYYRHSSGTVYSSSSSELAADAMRDAIGRIDVEPRAGESGGDALVRSALAAADRGSL